MQVHFSSQVLLGRSSRSSNLATLNYEYFNVSGWISHRWTPFFSCIDILWQTIEEYENNERLVSRHSKYCMNCYEPLQTSSQLISSHSVFVQLPFWTIVFPTGSYLA